MQAPPHNGEFKHSARGAPPPTPVWSHFNAQLRTLVSHAARKRFAAIPHFVSLDEVSKESRTQDTHFQTVTLYCLVLTVNGRCS